MAALSAAALGAAVLLAATPGSGAAGGPQVVYRFADPRIVEASGLAVGVRSPGVDWVQNDSGDRARVFAVDAATGATAAVLTVRGAVNIDWEDLAAAPDPAGTPSLWIADTGDNDAVRSSVTLYRVPEPRVPATARDRRLTSTRADVWRLRYPDGPVDTESLAVTPGGTAYLITKSPIGRSVVYRVPPRPDAQRVQTLVEVGSIAFTAHRTTQAFGAVGTLTATGAAFSADGRLFTIRTYADAYLWPVADDSDAGVAAALRGPPTRVPLPVQPQGEGIAIAGGRLLLDSEGVGAAVLAVPLPAVRPATASPSASVSAGRTGTTAVGGHGPGRTGAAGTVGLGAGVGVGLGVGAVLVVAAAALARRRRRVR